MGQLPMCTLVSSHRKRHEASRINLSLHPDMASLLSEYLFSSVNIYSIYLKCLTPVAFRTLFPACSSVLIDGMPLFQSMLSRPCTVWWSHIYHVCSETQQQTVRRSVRFTVVALGWRKIASGSVAIPWRWCITQTPLGFAASLKTLLCNSARGEHPLWADAFPFYVTKSRP